MMMMMTSTVMTTMRRKRRRMRGKRGVRRSDNTHFEGREVREKNGETEGIKKWYIKKIFD